MNSCGINSVTMNLSVWQQGGEIELRNIVCCQGMECELRLPWSFCDTWHSRFLLVLVSLGRFVTIKRLDVWSLPGEVCFVSVKSNQYKSNQPNDPHIDFGLANLGEKMAAILDGQGFGYQPRLLATQSLIARLSWRNETPLHLLAPKIFRHCCFNLLL